MATFNGPNGFVRVDDPVLIDTFNQSPLYTRLDPKPEPKQKPKQQASTTTTTTTKDKEVSK